jgi:hypothetical protein
MENYKFSATTTSFYPVSLLDMYEQAGSLPSDLIDVSDEEYTTFTGIAPTGKMRGSINGKPAWVDMPPPAPEAVIPRQARQLDEAEAVIRVLERAVKLGMATDEEKAQLEAWERYSVLLSRINPDDAPNINWPDKPE